MSLLRLPRWPQLLIAIDLKNCNMYWSFGRKLLVQYYVSFNVGHPFAEIGFLLILCPFRIIKNIDQVLLSNVKEAV